MIREIKFRAWDKEKNKMLKQDKYDITFWRYDKYGYKDVGFSVYADEIIPMQFTGLHDANGREIYEYDIVKFNSKGINGTGVIEFTNDHAVFEVVSGSARWLLWPEKPEHIEILGNIYETPHLLEGETP